VVAEDSSIATVTVTAATVEGTGPMCAAALSSHQVTVVMAVVGGVGGLLVVVVIVAVQDLLPSLPHSFTPNRQAAVTEALTASTATAPTATDRPSAANVPSSTSSPGKQHPTPTPPFPIKNPLYRDFVSRTSSPRRNHTAAQDSASGSGRCSPGTSRLVHQEQPLR
jgi:cytoskeletal protein RodZ